MMYCTFIQVGKTKDIYLVEGIREFEKRLSAFCKLEVKTLREEAFGTADQIIRGRALESHDIVKNIPLGDFVIYLDVLGKQLDSQGFAAFLLKKKEEGAHVTFIIGGAFGVDESILSSKIDFRLSLSGMTFTHQMVRLLFLEQLYRAHTIILGKPYHH